MLPKSSNICSRWHAGHYNTFLHEQRNRFNTALENYYIGKCFHFLFKPAKGRLWSIKPTLTVPWETSSLLSIGRLTARPSGFGLAGHLVTCCSTTIAWLTMSSLNVNCRRGTNQNSAFSLRILIGCPCFLCSTVLCTLLWICCTALNSGNIVPNLNMPFNFNVPHYIEV